jgi:hypothetical protein
MPYKFTAKQAYKVNGGKRDYMPKKQAIAILLSEKKAGK